MLQAQAPRRAGFVWACVLSALILCASGCKTHTDRIHKFSLAWEAADFPRAATEIDVLLVKESGAEPAAIAEMKGVGIDPGQGDACVLLLDKGMVNLALGDYSAAVDVWRACKEKLDERFKNNAADYLVATVLSDDTALDFAGADYEHILLRVMLAIADLLANGGDAYAYALQVGEKQEEIIGSGFGGDEGYKPREQYRRVGVGAYLQGLILEGDLASGEANLYYRRAKDFLGASSVVDAAIQRTEGNGPPPVQGAGVVHVFYLGGLGPKLIVGRSEITEAARLLAGVGIAIAGHSGAILVQAPVPVPACLPRDVNLPPLTVAIDGAVVGATESILDINQVAQEQLEANLPMIIARAVVRRTVKALLSEAAGDAVGGDWGDIVKLGGNLFSTVIETADTRSWSTLPSQIQVARLEIPGGEHELSLGALFAPQRIVVDPARETFIVVLQPNLSVPGVALVDPLSRVESDPGIEADAAPAVEPTPAVQPGSSVP